MDDVDRRILAFIGAHRFVLASQVQLFLELEPDVAAHRLRGLEGERLVRSERLLVGHASSVRITAVGLKEIGSRLPAPGFDLAGFRHEVGVVWMWVAAWHGVFGEAERVLSRRELEWLERAGGDGGSGFAVLIGGARGAGVVRYPDVGLVTAKRRIAIYLELRVPGSAELGSLLAAYRSTPGVAVLFVTEDPGVADAVRAAAARLGMSDRVRVQRARFWPTDRVARTG